MVKQTSVEWLWNLSKQKKELDVFDLQQAQQMHRQEVKSGYNKGYQDGEIDSLGETDGDIEVYEDAEQYYTYTYGRT